MSTPRSELLISGHSHAVAMGLPPAPRNSPASLVALGGGRLALTGGWPRREDYWSALEHEAHGRHVVLSWRGSEYLGEFLVAPTPVFDFVARARPQAPLIPGAVLVPELLVRKRFSPWVVDAVPVIERLKKVAASVILPAGPPPKDDDAMLRSFMETETAFKARMDKLGVTLDQVTLSPPLLRVKLWELTQDLLRETAETTAVTYVPCPSEARDEHGGLRREYWNNDITHGNPAFGALMLATIEAGL